MEYFEPPYEDERQYTLPGGQTGGYPGQPGGGFQGGGYPGQPGGGFQGGGYPGQPGGGFQGGGYPGQPGGGFQGGGYPGQPGGGYPGGGFPGQPGGGYPGGGFPGQPGGGYPGGGYPGQPGGGYPGGGFPGQSGGGGQQGAPNTPPPNFTPQQPQFQTYAVDPGAIRRCLRRFTFIWLQGGRSFWFYPTFIGRNSVAGFRWSGSRWVYFGIDLNRIRSFQCY